MDEIQLFKLMMKREAAKKENEKGQNGDTVSSVATPQPVENGGASLREEASKSYIYVVAFLSHRTPRRNSSVCIYFRSLGES